ncbi:MAG: hypothetical protein ISS70_21550 [Phycisphaerae bacterium]|nr:hypothetical protein [Phycisphaerae bacterium]
MLYEDKLHLTGGNAASPAVFDITNGRCPDAGRRNQSGRELRLSASKNRDGETVIALWDLRGKLLKQPAYRIIGKADRKRVPVYWRPGEASRGLDDACRRAREAYEKGYRYQEWYFTKSAKDGDEGLKENIELARVLREKLSVTMLMFDNHRIRYYADADRSVKLCKAIAPTSPFGADEPICPEHVDGYQNNRLPHM